MHMRMHGARVLGAALALSTAACAPLPERHALEASRYTQPGIVERIELVDAGRGERGLLIRGVVGGLIGAPLDGDGRHSVVALAGAPRGGVAGMAVDGRPRRDGESFRVTIRFDDGSLRTLVRDDIAELCTGDRVRLVGGRIVEP